MLTNPTRYGLIACRYLAWGWHYGVWLNAPEIAERYRINVRALSPALLRLVQAGILHSRVGGPKPGYMLSRDPAEIPMLEVVRALEGTFRMDCCRTVLPNVQCQCEADNCRYAECSGTYWTSFGRGCRVFRSKTMPQLKNFYQLTGG